MGPIKLGVIGAGSAEFSAGMVRDICTMPSLSGSSVVLMDVDGGRAETMHRFAQRYAAELGADVRFERTTDREAALRDADFVMNTAQIGGHDQVERLRAWCQARGYYRGFRLSAIIQCRFMVSVARDMERLCPNAWLIQASNPVFEGCTAMTRATGIKVCGLCHGHGGEYAIARVLGLDRTKVKGVSVGFNHEIWLTQFEYEGKNAYPLLDEWIETKSAQYWRDHRPHYGDNQMSPAAIELYKLNGLMPIGDTPRSGGWWFHQSLDAKRRWYLGDGGFDSEIGWAQYLRDTNGRVEAIQRAVADPSVKLTDLYPPRPTGEQHFPLIDALWNDNEATLQVNVPNNGAIAGIPDDVVVELPAVCSHRGIQPLQVGKLPDLLMLNQLHPRLLRAEQTIAMALHPDERLLLQMVLDDHRTKSWDDAVSFTRDALALPELADLAAAIAHPRHPFSAPSP
ncbi:MAG: alpha-glucosidase/alpha-galactosidase [Armatimonadota bacterium]